VENWYFISEKVGREFGFINNIGSLEPLNWAGLAGGLPLVCTADPLMSPL
jgi:hypothetical protein